MWWGLSITANTCRETVRPRIRGKVPGWNEIASFFDNPNLYAHFCGVVLLLVPWRGTPRSGRRWAAFLGLALSVLLVNTGGRLALAEPF